MNIAVMKETHPGETRVPMVPATVDRLVKLGAEVAVESGVGATCRFDDAAYEAAGARLATAREELLANADIVLRLRKPPIAEISLMRRGSLHVSYLDPFNEVPLVDAMVAAADDNVTDTDVQAIENVPTADVARLRTNKQLTMYKAISERRSVRKLYVEALVKRGDITVEEAESALAEIGRAHV